MATDYQKWEIGSNYSNTIGSIDLAPFMDKIKVLYPGIERDEVYVKAIKRGARLLADRIEARTPIRYDNLAQPSKQYSTRGHTRWHPPGQAKKNVIVYTRKGNKAVYQAEAIANLSVLVGFEKRMAYYMYWSEVGRRGQAARPVVRPVFDAGINEAIQMAMDYIKKDHDRRLGQ